MLRDVSDDSVGMLYIFLLGLSFLLLLGGHCAKVS